MADTQAPLLRRSAPEAPGAASRTSGVRAHRFLFFALKASVKVQSVQGGGEEKA